MRSLPLPLTIWERVPPGLRALVVDPYRQLAATKGKRRFHQRLAVSEPSHGARAMVGSTERFLEFSGRLGTAPLVEDSYGAQPVRRLLEIRRHLIAAPAVSRGSLTICSHTSALIWSGLRSARVTLQDIFYGILAQIAESDLLPPREQASFERTVEDVYEATDRAIGEILAAGCTATTLT